jgi:hypothetical protein
MTMRYNATRVDDDAGVRQRMRAGPRRAWMLAADYNDTRPHAQLGWKTPSEFASTCHPRRDLALSYAEGSAPAPVATTAQGTSKLRNRVQLTQQKLIASGIRKMLLSLRHPSEKND